MIDELRFQTAIATLYAQETNIGGIGTLGEKILHATLKHYIEPDPSLHEIKLQPFVVDILSNGHIYEIQTRQFGKLRPKLEAFLPDYPMTIVYPIPFRKWLLWIDPDSGEISKPRLSPKKGSRHDVFRELYRIKPLLSHPNLSILILFIDLEEYRLLNGWSDDRKKGSWRNDRIPLVLVSELFIEGPQDYRKLLPDNLPETFTSSEFAKASRISKPAAQTGLNILLSLNVISLVGKKGRMNLYNLNQEG